MKAKAHLAGIPQLHRVIEGEPQLRRNTKRANGEDKKNKNAEDIGVGRVAGQLHMWPLGFRAAPPGNFESKTTCSWVVGVAAKMAIQLETLEKHPEMWI